ncbi:MAG: transketolase [Candidatus Eremiobacteraeota bacterium]|nr:transketolase [Candidatus Eremiobacteraeota bacterium]
MPNSPDQEKRINAIRFLAVDAVQKANSGHPGLPLGAAAMAYALWTRHLRYDPADPHWFDRDRFILSAGHGSMLLYALLYLTGYDVTLDDLKAFRQFESKTPGHPEVNHTPGVEATTGPLGQGISNAVGFAIAEAHLAATYNGEQRIVDHQTYVIASDGDLMEGVSGESASLAGHLELGKLIVLYDDNHVSLAGPTSVTFTEDIAKRYEAYGWHTQTIEIEHGNDVDAIDRAIAAAKNETSRPSIVLVRTHIGFGSPRQDTYQAHGEPLGPDNVAKTKASLGWPLEPAFYVPDDVLGWWREQGKRGAELRGGWNETYAAWTRANPGLARELDRMRAGRLPDDLPWPSFNAENGAVATRDAGGTVMNAIAKALPELVGGSADLDPSTKTYLKGLGDFEPGTYAGRNIHFGVREHAMAAIANGIALHGPLLPFTATFFNFLDYMKPAVRLAALSRLRVIEIYTHDSIFLGEDGPTHQPVEQLATLRATPNIAVIRPADAVETGEAWKCAVASEGEPVALILTRQKVPFLGTREAPVWRGAYVLRDPDGGGLPDLILIATGSEVALAVEAAERLAKDGTTVRVVSMPCWEYFEAQDEGYRDSVLPPSVRARVSIEAGATFGWERWIGDRGVAIGVDRYGASAPAAAIAKAFGFTAEGVAEVASGLLAKA